MSLHSKNISRCKIWLLFHLFIGIFFSHDIDTEKLIGSSIFHFVLILYFKTNEIWCYIRLFDVKKKKKKVYSWNCGNNELFICETHRLSQSSERWDLQVWFWAKTRSRRFPFSVLWDHSDSSWVLRFIWLAFCTWHSAINSSRASDDEMNTNVVEQHWRMTGSL